MSFPESVTFLAGRLGITIPKSDRGDGEHRAEKRLRSLLRGLFVEVVSIYQEELKHDKSATDYLETRGLSLEIQEEFGLGLAPDKWDYLLEAVQKKITSGGSILPTDKDKLLELLVLSGLVKKKEERHYDSFRGRIIFPIFRSDGVPTALGGRIFAEGQNKNSPKYINSSESLIYEKRKTLYGLPQAIKHCSKKRHLFLVEGYMDVLSLSQIGVKNVVASCGTALTAEHIGVIKRIADRVTLIFDGDEAGKKAALSCFELFAGSGLEVTIVTPDKGEDPDSLAKQMDAAKVLEYFRDRLTPAVEFYFDCHIGKSDDEKSINAAVGGKLAGRFVKIVSKIPNPVERDILLAIGSKRLGASRESLNSLLAEFVPTKPKQATTKPSFNEFSPKSSQSKSNFKSNNPNKLSGIEASEALERIVGEKLDKVLGIKSLGGL